MTTKILRQILISISALFALTRLLAGATSDSVVNLGDTPSGHSHPTFITFDPPGSTSTIPSAITPTGAVIGSYNDASKTTHGFVRSRDGTISTFDGPSDIFGTQAYGINSAGAITGWYCDLVNCHGFLRPRNGTFTAFDVPGAVFGTFPVGINEAGVITGSWCDKANCHSFVRVVNGSFTTFDPAMVDNLSGIISPERDRHWLLFCALGSC